MKRRYALRDDQWERIKDLLPGRTGLAGATARDNRLFIDAVLYRYRAGIPWRDLPERFGDFRVVHLRHMRRSQRGALAQAIGRSRGGLSTKIHATVDALGNPTGFHLTPGQASDLEGADALLPGNAAHTLIADKAYDAHERIVRPLLEMGKTVVIPCLRTRKIQRDYDRHLYKARHLIENFFARLKQYRAIATRYDKTAAAFLGTVHLVGAITWLN